MRRCLPCCICVPPGTLRGVVYTGPHVVCTVHGLIRRLQAFYLRRSKRESQSGLAGVYTTQARLYTTPEKLPTGPSFSPLNLLVTGYLCTNSPDWREGRLPVPLIAGNAVTNSLWHREELALSLVDPPKSGQQQGAYPAGVQDGASRRQEPATGRIHEECPWGGVLDLSLEIVKLAVLVFPGERRPKCSRGRRPPR